MKTVKVMMAVALAAVRWAGAAQALVYSPVAFEYNQTIADSGVINGWTYPTGSLLLDGVPFSIPQQGYNFWSSNIAPGPNPRTLTIPVGIYGVAEVHSLMSTYWGEKVPGAYVNLQFFGSAGAFYMFELDGNANIRDYNYNPSYTTQINGTTTVEVWNNGGYGQHLDKQYYDLPDEFLTQTLSYIMVSDIGGDGFQRSLLFGLTVGQDAAPVPIPAAVWLLGSGLAGLAGIRRLRK